MRFVLGFLCFFALFVFTNTTHAYVFGLKSTDNSIKNIQDIENKFDIELPLVSFILDPYRYQDTIYQYGQLEFMKDKIFHITVSPGHMTALQVAKGEFDKEYLEFFQFVKDRKIKVVFRTMHEMNGNRYKWSGNTYYFKKARQRVWKLSRQVGLDQSQILFDFSVNHRDVVDVGGKHMRCYLHDTRPGCKTWENYYPGDAYVDVIGFTFYNRGKATSDRSWLRPEQILIHDGAGLLDRIASKKKPVFIDETGTSKVRYNQTFDFSYSQQVYNNGDVLYKNHWLHRLAYLIQQYPMIKGLIYFNVDYTAGLTYQLYNEADWLMVKPSGTQFETGFQMLLQMSQPGAELQKLFPEKNLK